MDDTAAVQLEVPTLKSQTIGSTLCIEGDCLTVMSRLPPKSIRLVFADLPYGMSNTGLTWDVRLNLQEFWAAVRHVSIPNAASILTATQPFTTIAISSNIKSFLYCYVWKKNCATNFFNAKTQPLKNHEDIAVFADKRPLYNPQKTFGHKNYYSPKKEEKSPHFKLVTRARLAQSQDGSRYPVSVQLFDRVASKSVIHPTQKPVALLEWLIRTYTNDGDTILDPVAGSGTTGIAALNLGRRAILIEKDPTYYKVMCKRIAEHQQKMEAARE